jgi:hypothetical protein
VTLDVFHRALKLYPHKVDMSDARIILLARNHQDDVMSTNPESTFFKFPERTATNFGEDWIPLDINYRNTPNFFQAGQSYYVDINNNADLLEELMINVTIDRLTDSNFNPATFGFNVTDARNAFNLFDHVEFLVNDKVIVRYPIEYILTLIELSDSYGKKVTQPQGGVIENTNAISDLARFEVVSPRRIQAFLPLKLWFCNCPANALPLWAAQNVRFGIRFKLINSLQFALNNILADAYSPTNYNIDIRLLARYGYLDIDEKRKFQSQPLEYIFEQVDFVRDDLPANLQVTRKYDIPRANYVKEIVWVYQGRIETATSDYYNSTFLPGCTSAQLLFNGVPVTTISDPKYYKLVQRYQSHNSGYAFQITPTTIGPLDEKSNVYCYSFSLTPDGATSGGFLTTEKYNNIVAEIGHFIPSAVLPNGARLTIMQRKMNILRVKDGKADTLFN